MVEAITERQTGAENVVWDLSVLYSAPDAPEIDADMQVIDEKAEAFQATFRGKIAALDAEEMREAMEALIAILDARGRLSAYASLLHSTDTAVPAHGALLQKVREFAAKVQEKLVFFDLEWNATSADTAARLLVDPVLAEYRHYLEAQRRYQPHQLTEPEEKIAIRKGVTGRQAWVRFFTQLMSSMRYQIDGKTLTQTQVLSMLKDPQRAVREQAANGLTAGLGERTMELTYIFNVLALDKAIDDELRDYPTWVASRNLSNKAPDSVVEALVSAVTGRYDLVARHYHLKRKLLDLDELLDYDRYAPLPSPTGEHLYTWDEAREIVLNAFTAFHPQMGEIAARFFDENWIHAALGPNKRGGAYASPVTPSAHPFVFLNFDGKANDVMTLAHELGHGIHMYLSAQGSNFFALYTPLTTAEMASVFAEMLVFSDLMAKEPDPAVRLSMLVEKIEDTFGTVYRQTAMNRFEHALHTARREEGELATERINTIWMDTQRDMHGDSVTLREDYGQWWSYIPHFLNTPGYVYAYAFGELLVLALYNLYLEQGEAFPPQYIDVLAAGDSDWPDRILAQLGVDLNDPAFWQRGLDAIAALIDQEEALAREVYPEKFTG